MDINKPKKGSIVPNFKHLGFIVPKKKPRNEQSGDAKRSDCSSTENSPLIVDENSNSSCSTDFSDNSNPVLKFTTKTNSTLNKLCENKESSSGLICGFEKSKLKKPAFAKPSSSTSKSDVNKNITTTDAKKAVSKKAPAEKNNLNKTSQPKIVGTPLNDEEYDEIFSAVIERALNGDSCEINSDSEALPPKSSVSESNGNQEASVESIQIQEEVLNIKSNVITEKTDTEVEIPEQDISFSSETNINISNVENINPGNEPIRSNDQAHTKESESKTWIEENVMPEPGNENENILKNKIVDSPAPFQTVLNLTKLKPTPPIGKLIEKNSKKPEKLVKSTDAITGFTKKSSKNKIVKASASFKPVFDSKKGKQTSVKNFVPETIGKKVDQEVDSTRQLINSTEQASTSGEFDSSDITDMSYVTNEYAIMNSQMTLWGRDRKLIYSQPPKTKSYIERMKYLQKCRNIGLWIQCSEKDCGKWRYCKDIKDPLNVPKIWFCSMNSDTEFNKCIYPEQNQPAEVNGEVDVIFSKYSAGSIVVARVDGFPWWPAMVDDDPNVEQFYWIDEPSKIPSWYHVVFFDSQKVTRAWVTSRNIEPFDPNNNYGRMLAKMTGYEKSALSSRMDAARQDANRALEMSVMSRLENYGFLARFYGPIRKPRIMASDESSEDEETRNNVESSKKLRDKRDSRKRKILVKRSSKLEKLMKKRKLSSAPLLEAQFNCDGASPVPSQRSELISDNEEQYSSASELKEIQPRLDDTNGEHPHEDVENPVIDENSNDEHNNTGGEHRNPHEDVENPAIDENSNDEHNNTGGEHRNPHEDVENPAIDENSTDGHNNTGGEHGNPHEDVENPAIDENPTDENNNIDAFNSSTCFKESNNYSRIDDNRIDTHEEIQLGGENAIDEESSCAARPVEGSSTFFNEEMQRSIEYSIQKDNACSELKGASDESTNIQLGEEPETIQGNELALDSEKKNDDDCDSDGDWSDHSILIDVDPLYTSDVEPSSSSSIDVPNNSGSFDSSDTIKNEE